MPDEINARGNTVIRMFQPDIDRYRFDFGLCTTAKGWQQFDTDQDASYFGVWVHQKDRRIVTYAEGDIIILGCASSESFKAELDHMAAFYGQPPPAFVAFDADGTRTEFFDTRPTGDDEGSSS